MASNLDWAQAMYDRVVDGLPGDWDIETKELIGQAFLAGMLEYPDILMRLKSSSLIDLILLLELVLGFGFKLSTSLLGFN